ncbi:glycosyltransferase family 2 protein [Nonlabens ulvanivorans]|uniref:Glycosyl transferase family 2 n=1 Tax=Nonlabens ulvanivorans TaxID=906888 RepID=A0ABX5E5J4_NONUL|nr:glycosyltransferase [Nonlabens ulvanivorans]PRX14365.1 glycosyl transferase family 2 [Nonlabens ulvanivorans]
MRHLNNLISIILPVYNGQKYVRECIESCIKQSYENWELIVVNDCSTDSTLELIEEYSKKDPRILIVNNKTNQKLPKSLNVGHQMAKGELMTWISHDNIFDINFLERMRYHLNSTRSDIVYSDFQIIDKEEVITGTRKLSSLDNLLLGNPIQASFLYKREVFKSLNGYDENLFLVEDYDFWLRASLNFKFSHCNEQLYFFRKHESSLTENINRNTTKFQQYSKALTMSYGNLNNNMFSETTVDLLVNLHLTDRKSSKLSGYKVIKFLNLAIEEISEFEKVIGLTKTSCTKVLIEKIKKNIFSGRIEISLCALLYCSFYWPETLLLKNNYNFKRLVRSYLNNPLRIC